MDELVEGLAFLFPSVCMRTAALLLALAVPAFSQSPRYDVRQVQGIGGS